MMPHITSRGQYTLSNHTRPALLPIPDLLRICRQTVLGAWLRGLLSRAVRTCRNWRKSSRTGRGRRDDYD
jgi:hypothetical protein